MFQIVCLFPRSHPSPEPPPWNLFPDASASVACPPYLSGATVSLHMSWSDDVSDGAFDNVSEILAQSPLAHDTDVTVSLGTSPHLCARDDVPVSRCEFQVSVASFAGGASAPHSRQGVDVHMSRSDASDDTPVIVSGPLMSRSVVDPSDDAFDIVSDNLALAPLAQDADVTVSLGTSSHLCARDDVPVSRCEFQVSVASAAGGALAPHSRRGVDVHMSRSDASDDDPVIISDPLLCRSVVSDNAFNIVSNDLTSPPLPRLADVADSGGDSPSSSWVENGVPAGRCEFDDDKRPAVADPLSANSFLLSDGSPLSSKSARLSGHRPGQS